jgi:hypothetical protein
MKEHAATQKSLLLKFGLFAGFRLVLWKGEEIISRIRLTPVTKRHVQRPRSVKDPFPASSWMLIGRKPCCMALEGDRLEIHVLSDRVYN